MPPVAGILDPSAGHPHVFTTLNPTQQTLHSDRFSSLRLKASDREAAFRTAEHEVREAAFDGDIILGRGGSQWGEVYRKPLSSADVIAHEFTLPERSDVDPPIRP